MDQRLRAIAFGTGATHERSPKTVSALRVSVTLSQEENENVAS